MKILVIFFIPIAKSKTTTLNYQALVLNMIQKKYPYLLLGLTVLLVIYFVFAGFLSKRKLNLFQAQNTNKSNNQQEIVKNEQKTYVVKEGDDLWHIAEATYGSGYNAYDIASANKLANASLIEPGWKLVLPSLTPKEPTTGEVAPAQTEKVTITGARYTVQSGDYLWKIALAAYGDGYSWVRIAQANNLADPNIIHEGNVFIIPR